MSGTSFRLALMSVGVLAITLGGCTGYVKKADFDSTVAELRANDQKQQQEIDALSQEMQKKFAAYDTQITQMQGRIRVDTMAHFAYNDATLRDQDKPFLDDFAKVISGHFPDAVVTVEGFADPDGGVAYNRHLGEERAKAVRDYLVSPGGLSADKVRTVSYGKATNREVLPGKSKDEGGPNRRVSVVVDFAGASTPAS